VISLPPTIITSYKCEYYSTRNNQPIRVITAHSTVGKNSLSYLANGGNGRGVSIHCLIQKFPRADRSIWLVEGKPEVMRVGAAIYRMLDDSLAANHAGYSQWQGYRGATFNDVSLGFELENLQDGRDPYTGDQLLAMGWLINHWRSLYGPLPVVRHEDIDFRQPKERYDPVGLTVDEIENWCLRAMQQSSIDIWGLWGSNYLLMKNWTIPQCWYKRARELGACMSNETYINDCSFQMFERGFCVYYKANSHARAYLYSEI